MNDQLAIAGVPGLGIRIVGVLDPQGMVSGGRLYFVLGRLILRLNLPLGNQILVEKQLGFTSILLVVTEPRADADVVLTGSHMDRNAERLFESKLLALEALLAKRFAIDGDDPL